MQTKVKFLPLLVVYILFVVVASSNTFWADEDRYVWFANNLSHGYYSPGTDINLWNGPGYPLVLVPFVLLSLPWLSAKILNAFLLFFAIIYFYSTLRLYIRERSAFYVSYLFGIYPPLFKYMQYLLTESLAIFLVCGFVFHFCRLNKSEKVSRGELFIAGLYLGYLALTKILFGYVILTGLIVFGLLLLWRRTAHLKRTVWVYSLALLCCLPYLFYTYSLTGKVFYWGNSGGDSLYWMSTPYSGELGSWFTAADFRVNPQLLENHGQFLREVDVLPSIQRDEALMKRAVENIKNNPGAFLRNVAANIGRLLFSYPYGYTPQKLSTYFYIAPNMFIVVFFIIAVYLAYVRRKLVPWEVHALLFFGLVSFAGTAPLSGVGPRHFAILVPIFLLWTAVVLARTLKVEMR